MAPTHSTVVKPIKIILLVRLAVRASVSCVKPEAVEEAEAAEAAETAEAAEAAEAAEVAAAPFDAVAADAEDDVIGIDAPDCDGVAVGGITRAGAAATATVESVIACVRRPLATRAAAAAEADTALAGGGCDGGAGRAACPGGCPPGTGRAAPVVNEVPTFWGGDVVDGPACTGDTPTTEDATGCGGERASFRLLLPLLMSLACCSHETSAASENRRPPELGRDREVEVPAGGDGFEVAVPWGGEPVATAAVDGTAPVSLASTPTAPTTWEGAEGRLRLGGPLCGLRCPIVTSGKHELPGSNVRRH